MPRSVLRGALARRSYFADAISRARGGCGCGGGSGPRCGPLYAVSLLVRSCCCVLWVMSVCCGARAAPVSAVFLARGWSRDQGGRTHPARRRACACVLVARRFALCLSCLLYALYMYTAGPASERGERQAGDRGFFGKRLCVLVGWGCVARRTSALHLDRPRKNAARSSAQRTHQNMI